MSRVLIIAEAGVNHNGDLKTAKELVKTAAVSGADLVKFQTFKASAVATKNAQKADYQEKTTTPSESQYEMIRKLELIYLQIDLCYISENGKFSIIQQASSTRAFRLVSS